MKRHEAQLTLIRSLPAHLVTCYLGAAAEEVYADSDSPRIFYMLGSMGLCSSIGLGVALAGHHRVLAIEGDGSTLMNLGALTTIAAAAPAGFVLGLIDNKMHAATGGQPTATARGANLLELARAAGFTWVSRCCTVAEVAKVAQEAALAQGPVLVHMVVEPGDGPRRLVDLRPSEQVARFRAWQGGVA